MPRFLIAIAALLVGMPALWGADQPKGGSDPPKEKSTPDKPQTPEEQFKALLKKQREDQQAFMKAYTSAKTDEERQKLAENYPDPKKYEKEIFELAEKNPKEPFAAEALIWVVNNRGTNSSQALEMLVKDHLENKKIGSIAQGLVYSQAPNADKILLAILEKNPDHAVQGQACLALGRRMKQKANRSGSADTADIKDAEKYFNMTVEKYSDVKYFGKKTLGDAAKGALFEIHNLAIGMTAPEIEGKDIDGKDFKLSDYRGKVVLLDFWGNW